MYLYQQESSNLLLGAATRHKRITSQNEYMKERLSQDKEISEKVLLAPVVGATHISMTAQIMAAFHAA